MKFTRIAIGVLSGSMMLLAGCAATQTANNGGAADTQAAPVMKLSEHQHQVANGDIQEETKSLTDLPTFLLNQDPKIIKAYKVAAANKDLISQMPCYCGCGGSAGHMSNLSCFIHEVKSDGTVVWDDHGTRCDTCMNIAVTSANLKEAGKSVLEIRNIIDGKYKEGYAQPTPTPMPTT
ncbi:PCYCGC motif-containing (lipo)protein [Tumebacillus permanentifrigoris]|uniref:Uncharacterized protein with PCYCGC motif n=1 Tax=Tumebacillus permanentifrigoris TaxID=378543 RepID=A0A316D684_9BACL|nr:PCYCGC motif-containing (lipo)protein [Tumebacillus permanentifrigoris]PWK07451.1 uncharacterized protein with PCYCGC motif [Tumebacillus permanentifrigoris]